MDMERRQLKSLTQTLQPFDVTSSGHVKVTHFVKHKDHNQGRQYHPNIDGCNKCEDSNSLDGGL